MIRSKENTAYLDGVETNAMK